MFKTFALKIQLQFFLITLFCWLISCGDRTTLIILDNQSSEQLKVTEYKRNDSNKVVYVVEPHKQLELGFVVNSLKPEDFLFSCISIESYKCHKKACHYDSLVNMLERKSDGSLLNDPYKILIRD